MVIETVERSTSCANPLGKRIGQVRKLLIVPSAPVGFRFVEAAT
jgi:hypothetical protein